ncbi:MAG: rane-flanked domain [Frankiales bacterium]|nr:rane-flanked domain [Frankiales bacterium]
MTAPADQAPSAPPGAGGPAPDLSGWHRLHPLSPVVRTGRAFVPVVLVVGGSLVQTTSQKDVWWHLVVVGLIAIAGVVSWLVTRWRVEGGDLRIESGLLRRESQRIPLARVQAVDIVRPGIARALGLAELRLRSAGSAGDAGRLAYLRADEAERVRARLLALAHGVAPETPAPPERPLFAQRRGRLTASVVLSRPFAVLAAFAVAVAVTAVFSPAAARGIASASVAYVLAVATLVWRRFNGGWGLQVGEAADGIRLRFGALETTAETIPRGRVQALELTEPVAWRPMGWVRLQLGVAGHARNREERQSDTRELRTVLPAGSRAEADLLLDRLLPARPGTLRPPPRRARWKSPLRYRWLGVGWNAAAIVVSSGRITRRTTWVPLARVQSLRLVQGPVQRRLRLASLHIDAAGKRLTAVARDRDAREAEQLLSDLGLACREAREPLRRPG